MKSMTGYGSSSIENDNLIIKTEVKSLNSKFFEFKLRVPAKYLEREIELRNYLEKKLFRGKIDLVIIIQQDNINDIKKNINTELLKAYYKDISLISNELGLPEEQILSTLLRFPDILSAANFNEDIEETEWSQIVNSIDLAIKEFNKFRINEGEKLSKEILKYHGIIEKYCKEIDKTKDERLNKINERIRTKLIELENVDFDKDRFEQELIYYIDKLDISEEIERLLTHLEYFKKTMIEEHSGKKLNFISQEMGREINTIGSKANDSTIQHKVVLMKNELEKIKQQLANIL